MKKLFIDVETTGLSPWKCQVIELAYIIEINGEVKNENVISIAPLDGTHISPEALEVNGKSLEELQRGLHVQEALKEFRSDMANYVNKFNKSDKFLFYAYNSPFDNNFTRELFKKGGDKFFGSWFFNPDICIMRLAIEKLAHIRGQMKNFKQGLVATELGIQVEKEKLHDALYDVRICREIYHKLKEGEQVCQD